MHRLVLTSFAVALMAFSAIHLTTASSTDAISSADLPLEARNSDTSSQEEDLISSSYVLPNQIFNDGKPYYVDKDPISGQPDFSAKKSAGIETSVNEVFDPKEKIVLSSSSPNIHDFLNLPVKYSSSKFVYPLVSSSYANLKYQGNNKNFMTNKKPTSESAAVTPASSYHSHNYYTVPTTKLMPVPPTAAGIYTTNKTASKKPTTTTTTLSTTTSTTTTTTTTKSTTTTRPPTSSTPKYTTTTRKPTPISTTTQAPRTTPTRKKFVPTKKYSPSTTTASTASTPMRFPTEKPAATSFASRPASTQTTVYPSRPPTTLTTLAVQRQPSTNQPVVFTESPSSPPVPTINTTPRIPNLEPADVYQTLGQKHTEQHFEQKPSMTLADIFNSLAEEESAISLHNQGNQGFDAQGNLIQPIEPSKPSPFNMPQNPIRPTFGTKPHGEPSPPPPQRFQPQQQPQQTQQQLPMAQNEQKLISGSQENYSNEYVSYQVQQPNVLQYRPSPGTINNVVISPGQNSATFVLGSQQQVGTHAIGSIEKEPLFAKEPPVQYGTVINEDISSIARPISSTMQNSFATQQVAVPPPTFQQIPGTQLTSNFHQNGNFAHSSVEPESPTKSPVKYHENPPAAPTPYQQLPLIGTTKRPQKQQQQLPKQRPQSNQHSGYQQPNLNQLIQSGPTKPSTSYTQPQTSSQQPSSLPASIQISNEQETQELLVSTNIRFPANDEQDNEFGHNSLLNAPPAGPHVNGHAQPLSLQQLQHSNPVVFPKANEDEPNKQLMQGANVQNNELHYNQGDVQIQQHEVLNINQHKQKLNFPQSSGNEGLSSTLQHIPSQHMEPPPRFNPQETPKRPQPNRPQTGPHPPAYMFNEFSRKPLPSMNRPNTERQLPNILPQFRPNAKISSGHSSNYNQEPGNIRMPSNQPPKHSNNSPHFAHRHQPLPQAQQLQQQQRYSMKRIADFAPIDSNKRHYRLPPYGGHHPQFADRLYPRRPMPNGISPSSPNGYAFERHASSPNTEHYKTLPQTMPLEKLAAFEEEDLVINDPPQPVTPSKDTKVLEDDKLEPVVTLQMLHSLKKTTSPTHTEDSNLGDIQVSSASSNTAGVSPFQSQASKDGLYVVYPMRPDADPQDQHIAAESKAPLPAIAHIESAPTTGSGEYQNTPFSILRDQPQEPILMVKKKPQSLQQQTKQKSEKQLPKDKFPYPIEKPDPSFTELNRSNRVAGVLLAPRIINGSYQPSGTLAPIALAYTPTEPNVYKNHVSQPQQHVAHNQPSYSNVNLASSVINEIRIPNAQNEETLNNDFDFRGQNYEKDFMAPFYPSISLGSVTDPPSNGWNILPSSTDISIFEKNYINRADVGDTKEEDDEVEVTTRSLELDSFQPEMQGGFKPIYPPGYKQEDEQDVVHLQEGINMPVALASRMELPVDLLIATTSSTTSTTHRPHSQLSSSSTASSSTSTTSTTAPPTAETAAPSTTPHPQTSPKPTIRKKSAFENSLAALLFGDEDEDFKRSNNEARKGDTIKAVSGPRSNMPRSGPRSLKLS